MQVNEVTERKITDKRQAFFLFVICWMAYFTCYIGRLNYSSAMAAMIEEAVLTKTQAGTISMVYFFVYGSGQLLNGFLGDRLPPGRMIFGGLFLSMICNLLMGVSGSFGIMAVVWGINGYAQSMVWPPIIRIFARRLAMKKAGNLIVACAICVFPMGFALMLHSGGGHSGGLCAVGSGAGSVRLADSVLGSGTLPAGSRHSLGRRLRPGGANCRRAGRGIPEWQKAF